MVGSYLKVALRNIHKNKVYSFINIVGLAIGMAACILIALYVINEESYDTFNKNADRIVRATMTFGINGVAREVAVTGTKLLPAFERNFPEVESGVRMYETRATVKYQDKIFEEPHFAFADSTFFRLFSFELLQGDPVQALASPHSVILTASAAKKYFGIEDPVGRLMRVNMQSVTDNYTVTGIMQDCPSNSQLKFDFLASFSSLANAKPGNEQWWNANYFTYLLLKSPESRTALQAKIPAYMKTQYTGLGISGDDYLTFNLEPLKSVHLYSRVEGGFEPSGDYRYVIIFSLVALLILVIACANYINITIAKAAERAKEVGVRKVIGASRRQLVSQFVSESFFLVAIAFFVGLMLVEYALPTFRDLYGVKLAFSSLLSTQAFAVLISLILLIGFLGAGYPAFLLSMFQPAKVLKGDFRTGSSGVWLRKSLIVLQFIISVGLIICTLVIGDQLHYVQDKKLGYEKNNIVVLPVNESMHDRVGAVKDEFLKNSHVQGVTFATRTPVFINSTNDLLYHNKKILVHQIGVDVDFLKTLEVQLIAGGNFTRADTLNYMSDGAKTDLPVIVNETAVQQLGLTPEEAIGKMLVYGIDAGSRCRIKGVIKDFYFASMHVRIDPLVLFPNGYLNQMLVRISGGDIEQTIRSMKESWDALIPDHPFTMTFLNDDFNRLYASETRTREIFSAFGILAIALACLGLFGLVSFSVQQRTKEIGIRKTLGAGTGSIVALVAQEYIRLVILASLIASPIAWYAASRWLEGFAYRTELSAWTFAVVMLLTFALVMMMIGLQSVKAAMKNPVESLRYE
jgi:putative ABC transport system permease protein